MALALKLRKHQEYYKGFVGPPELGGIKRVVVSENEVTRYSESSVVIESFYCLPDTMDPRG